MTYKDIENYKTLCCKSPWRVASRANYRCTNCNEDVTLEILLLANLIKSRNHDRNNG